MSTDWFVEKSLKQVTCPECGKIRKTFEPQYPICGTCATKTLRGGLELKREWGRRIRLPKKNYSPKGWHALRKEIARYMKYLGYPIEARPTADLVTPPYYFAVDYSDNPGVNVVEVWTRANSEMQEGEVPIAVVRLKEEKLTLVALTWRDFERLIKNGINPASDTNMAAPNGPEGLLEREEA